MRTEKKNIPIAEQFTADQTLDFISDIELFIEEKYFSFKNIQLKNHFINVKDNTLVNFFQKPWLYFQIYFLT